MQLRKTTKEEFLKFITDDKADSFIKTFIIKCELRNMWDKIIGYWDGDELLGASVTTISKRKPFIANFQLLHTFAKHRKKGVGTFLLQNAYNEAILNGVEYFRITSEKEALDFYLKRGLKFWGEQKGGCILSLFKINGNSIANGIYDIEDPIIKKTLFSNMKGSVSKLYNQLLCVE